MVNEYSFKIRKSLRALGGEGKRKKLGEFLAKNGERIEREIGKKKKKKGVKLLSKILKVFPLKYI